MTGSCLLQYDYSLKSENNRCSVYMNKTFYGHTPNMNGLFSIVVIDIFIILMPKDAKLIKIAQQTSGTAV